MVAQVSPRSLSRSKSLLGCLCVFASAFFFYLATTTIRWSASEVRIDPAFFVFARFLVGLIVVTGILAIKGQPVRPRRYDLLVGRTLANSIAVYCFYRAVNVTTVAQANILNMTYPVFIAVISWVVLKGQRDRLAVFMVLTAFAGVWLILSPGRIGLELDSLWGLGSGVSAAAAIIFLNISRQYHDTETILVFMFGLGSLIIGILFFDSLFIPRGPALFYLVLCSAFGVGGQYLLTLGFRYVTAVEGGVISSTRILLAAILGPYIAADPPMTVYGWIGALLIFGANVFLTLRKARKQQRNSD